MMKIGKTFIIDKMLIIDRYARIQSNTLYFKNIQSAYYHLFDNLYYNTQSNYGSTYKGPRTTVMFSSAFLKFK